MPDQPVFGVATICPECKGEGFIDLPQTAIACPTCNTAGWVKEATNDD